MSTSYENQSHLARALNELYNNQLTEGEAQEASRIVVELFKILDTVNTRQKRIQSSKGLINGHHRSSN